MSLGEGFDTSVWKRLIQRWAPQKAGEKDVLPHLFRVVLRALSHPEPLSRKSMWLGADGEALGFPTVALQILHDFLLSRHGTGG